MLLKSGTRLGPYEIQAAIGAGGMGEVYRGRDSRLGRSVAIKVLPIGVAGDPDRLRRFEQEARAASQLNHPNVIAVYDIGVEAGTTFVVSELLEGDTLRQRLQAGPLPPRKAIEHAIQIARGLAAAHDRGIVHRDLKPENLFLTRDGLVKILDFGLAKLVDPVEASAGPEADLSTLPAGTEPGVVLGTAGYMAPEQVRGQRADHRADLFAFGAILYEMLAGRRAFAGDSAVETMHAILAQDPPELSAAAGISPALERIVRHCLEKNREDRFQSARDLAFDLETASTSSGLAAAKTVARSGAARRWLVLTSIITVAVVGIIAFVGGQRIGYRTAQQSVSPPEFHRLTFGRGTIETAAFAPDGNTVVYSAAWDGKPARLFMVRPESPEARDLQIADVDILGISTSGEMAIGMPALGLGGGGATGNELLARVPLAGGVPRPVLEHTRGADWSRDGSTLAVIRQVGSRDRVEYPIGTVLYEAVATTLEGLRVSPNGEMVAFWQLRGWKPSVVVVDRKRNPKTVWAGDVVNGLAWSPRGDEIWFASANTLYAADLSGRVRVLARAPEDLFLRAVSANGRAVVSQEAMQVGVTAFVPGERREQDLSWLDRTWLAGISDDGMQVLLHNVVGTASYSAYLRRIDGSPPVRLGDGPAVALSGDGKWALLIVRGATERLSFVPTGAGELRLLPPGPVTSYNWAMFSPDHQKVVFVGNETGHDARGYVQDLPSSAPVPFTPEGIVDISHVASDGRRVAVVDRDAKAWIYTLDGKRAEPVAGLQSGDSLIRFDSNGRFLYVLSPRPPVADIVRIELSSGHREMWKRLNPADPTGVVTVNRVAVTPDGRSYAYSYVRELSVLYLVEGLR